MEPKGGEVSDSTGCTLLGPPGCVTVDWGGVAGDKTQGFSTRMTGWHSTQACSTTVTWVGQVTFDPVQLSHMCPLCHRFSINFTHLDSMDLTRFQYKAQHSDRHLTQSTQVKAKEVKITQDLLSSRSVHEISNNKCRQISNRF